MPRKKKSPDLHGSAPDKSDTALLIIDMLNPMDFPGNQLLVRDAMKAAERIYALKAKARRARIPVIYVNDNFGRWRSNLEGIVTHCLAQKSKVADIAGLLKPDEEDYFVLKPKHSAFFMTSLEILLEHLEVENLILTGVAANICIWFTANDAHMRDFKIWVPADCTASNRPEETKYALQQMKKVMNADITPSRRKNRAEKPSENLRPLHLQ
jgi:nicotinamidase-related amidase